MYFTVTTSFGVSTMVRMHNIYLVNVYFTALASFCALSVEPEP